MNGRLTCGLSRTLLGVFLVGIAPATVMTAAGQDRGQVPVIPQGAGTEGDPYRVDQIGNLVWMKNNVDLSYDKFFVMQNNIDASKTAEWNNGEGFVPIGTFEEPFYGNFDGKGKTIINLTINRPGENNVGLFGYVVDGGVVKNLCLSGGSVTGNGQVGGLVGQNFGAVLWCYATCHVYGNKLVGGLVGVNWLSTAVVSGCYASGTVTGGSNDIGGLVGYNWGGASVTRSHATGPVIASSLHSFRVGGLVGCNSASGTVRQCYATGWVSGYDYIGGLVGLNDESGVVSECYSCGQVSGEHDVGGLVGYAENGTTLNSYWDMQTSGRPASAGGTAKDTAEMKQMLTFTGWSFAKTWRISDTISYPSLRDSLGLGWQLPAGQTLCWLLNAGGSAQSTHYINNAASSWRLCAEGDMNVDGVSDLIWQAPTGEVVCWLMRTDGFKKTGYYVSESPSKWKVCAAGDINKDGASDLFWQLPAGNVLCWLMKTDGKPKSSFYIHNAATTWQVRAAGDINKDGVADLIWQLPTGQVLCWLMNAGGTKKSAFYILNSPTSWQVRTTGDVDRNGISDLIWQLPTGQVLCWLMNSGGTKKSSFYIHNSPTTWQVRCTGW